MSHHNQNMFLSGQFVEVATVITMAKDLKEPLSANEAKSAASLLDHYSKGQIFYSRQQYFELDGCDIDDEVREMAVTHSRRLQEVNRLYEQLQMNPTSALVAEFQKVMAHDDFRDLLTATVPNDLRMEFEDEGKRTMQVRVISQVPFQKTRELILGKIDEADDIEGLSLASVAISAHMRFLPPAAKNVGAGFQATIKGLQ